MENKKEFLGEIRTHLSNASAPGHKRKGLRSKKLLGIPLMPLLLAITVGATLILTMMSFDMTGVITLNGQPQPELKFDAIVIDEETTAIPLDIISLSPGDNITVVHCLNSTTGDRTYNVSFDTTSMPLEYIDEDSEYYGFAFHIYLHDTTDEITYIEVVHGTAAKVDFVYSLNADYLDQAGDGFTFPFDVQMTATII